MGKAIGLSSRFSPIDNLDFCVFVASQFLKQDESPQKTQKDTKSWDVNEFGQTFLFNW
jgi:hypothetical protein